MYERERKRRERKRKRERAEEGRRFCRKGLYSKYHLSS